MSMYSVLLGATALLHYYAPYQRVVLGAKIWVGTAGATMLWNMIRLRGRDSSGPLSTYLERKKFNYLA